jgi:hypothetical protein
MDKWKFRWMMDGWMAGCLNGWMFAWMYRWMMDEWMDV